MSLADFFNSDDGLTVQALIVEDDAYLTGFLDVIDSEYFVDDAPAETRAEFLCEATKAPRTLVGKTLTVNNQTYRINSHKPDGTGVVKLILMSTE